MALKREVRMLMWRGQKLSAVENRVTVKVKDSRVDFPDVIARVLPGAEVERALLGDQWYVVRLPENITIADAIAKFEAAPEVEAAEPVEVYEQSNIPPNDTEYGQQWALRMIGAEAGWTLTTGSDRVLIGVIDSGIELSGSRVAHPDFDNGRFIMGSDYVEDDAAPQLPDDSPPTTPAVTESPKGNPAHGQVVAGVIAARANNAAGIAGLNWGSDIYIAKVFGWYHYSKVDAATNQTKTGWAIQLSASDLADAIQAAVDFARARQQRLVMNFSGSSPTGGTLVEDAIKYLGDYGGLLCAASGNGADHSANPPVPGKVGFPARLSVKYDHVIAVGASTATDDVWNHSNAGVELTVIAPGSNILTLARSTATHPYRTANGTSLAAPYVAALASLVWSRNPNLSAKQVRDLIVETAVKLDPARDFDPLWGYGRIDVAAALAATPKPDDAGGTVGNFVSVSRSAKRVTKTNPASFVFNLPQDLDVASPGILQFLLLYNGASNLDFHIVVNGTGIVFNNFQGSEYHTFHWTVPAGVLKKGQNTARFAIRDGDGAISVDEVLVMFRQV